TCMDVRRRVISHTLGRDPPHWTAVDDPVSRLQKPTSCRADKALPVDLRAKLPEAAAEQRAWPHERRAVRRHDRLRRTCVEQVVDVEQSLHSAPSNAHALAQPDVRLIEPLVEMRG